MSKEYKFDPNAIMMYAINEPLKRDETVLPIYIEDINNAIQQAAEKRFKWYLILNKSNFMSFDTVEQLEKYLNENEDDTDCMIFFGQKAEVEIQQRYVIKENKSD